MPVADEPLLPVERYGADRVFVAIGLQAGAQARGGAAREQAPTSCCRHSPPPATR